MSQEPRATVRVVDGEIVLDDPDALEMMRAVGKHNCKGTLEMNSDRVGHFVRRMEERNLSALDAVVVLLNVDDINGGTLADILMPHANWQEFRDRGEVPFARGLAVRKGIEIALGAFDKEAATKLAGMDRLAVVVVDHGVAEIFPA